MEWKYDQNKGNRKTRQMDRLITICTKNVVQENTHVSNLYNELRFFCIICYVYMWTKIKLKLRVSQKYSVHPG